MDDHEPRDRKVRAQERPFAPVHARSVGIAHLDGLARKRSSTPAAKGGFLRLLADRREIVEGFGYDPASGAIEDARRLAGQRPLQLQAADTVPAGWRGFAAAFSHEVLYLLHDLSAHAQAIFGALAPGGVYYAGRSSARRRKLSYKVAIVLAEVELPAPMTSSVLKEQVEEATGAQLPSDLAGVEWLAPWAVALRYDEPTALDRATALAIG